MFNRNVIAIDVAKSSFQVVVVDKKNEIISNRSRSRRGLENWLAKQEPSIVAMEACGSAHHWGRLAEKLGHTALLLPPKNVTPFRQGHKTDSTDTIAIATAVRQPKVKPTYVKSIEQQGLQSLERTRQHWLDLSKATSNMLRGLLYEFGLTIPKGRKALGRALPDILEDGENDLPDMLRQPLDALYQALEKQEAWLREVEKQLHQLTRQQPEVTRLMALEGIGPVNALGLYLVLGDNGKAFKNGREAAACIGTTPQQYSTGGKVSLGQISKRSGHKRLRANLIQGGVSVVETVLKRPPKNTKEKWLLGVIERRGKRRAATALANKNIRTAWAMLHQNEEYRKPLNIAA